MSNVSVYNQEGAPVGTIELDPTVFAVPASAAVLHQIVVAAAANARTPIAHTKTRGEVRGGGRKPWRQKGTGRARHGSIRSPIWVGGGTTFGPRSERSYAQKVNTKMRRQALRMALSEKVAASTFVVVEDFVPDGAKTKAAKRLLDTVLSHAKTDRRMPSVLIALPSDRRSARLALQNLPRVTGIDAVHLNVLDIVRSDVLVMTRRGVELATAAFRPRASERIHA